MDTTIERSTWAARSHELAQLMSRSAMGDRAAFASLYDLTSGHLFAVVLRIQRAVGSFDAAQSQPMTWLTSVARNKAIDSLRRAQSQPVLQSVHRDDDDDDRPDLDQQIADETAGPVDLLSQAGDARRLNTCMQVLTASQRQSVALAFFDGLSHAEVAAHLHQPLGTVKSWVRRALLSLKECHERAAQRDTVGA